MNEELRIPTADLLAGLREMWRQWKQNGSRLDKPGRLPSTGSGASSPIVQAIEVTSGTADADGYPARILTQDENGDWNRTYDEVRAVPIGGGTLSEGFSVGRLMRVSSSGRHIYGVLATIGGARVYLDSAQTVSNGSIETLSGFVTTAFMSEDVSIYYYDNDGYFDAGNPERLTIPEDGVYLIGCEVHWDAGSTGYRQIEIFDPHESTHLAVDHAMPVSASFSTVQSVSTVIKAVAGAYFYVRVYHTEGTDLDVLGKIPFFGPRTVFWIHKLSGTGSSGGAASGAGTLSNQDSDDVTFDGQVTINGSVSPAQITGDVNDYNPTGWN